MIREILALWLSNDKSIGVKTALFFGLTFHQET